MATEVIQVHAVKLAIRHGSIKKLLKRSAASPEVQGLEKLASVKHFRLNTLIRHNKTFPKKNLKKKK